MELNMINVTIFAEYLRDHLLEAKPPLLKSRRQLFRSYPSTFVGSEVVDWMIKEWHQIAIKRSQDELDNNNCKENQPEMVAEHDQTLKPEDASRILFTLTEFGIVHSVHGDIPFKNDTSLYRFTADDGTGCGLVEALVKGKRLHKLTLCPNCKLFQRVCEYGEIISEKCMRGSDLITWIIEHKLASHREDAKRLCKLMFDHGILKPASKHVTEFLDDRPFYIFGIDYTAPPMDMMTFLSLLNSSTPLQVPSTSNNASGQSQPQHVRQLSGQLLDLSVQDSGNIGRRKNTSSSSIGSDDSGYNENASNAPSCASRTYESLLDSDGKPTPEALTHPDAPFTKKEMRIFPDAVGYGFIIRGTSPCFVKIVDPESPAGKTGLKAWQYITEIHNRDVTRKTHTEIENIILSGPKCLVMTIMVPKDERAYAYIQRVNTDNKSSESDARFPKPVGELHNSLRRQSLPVTPRTLNLPTAQPWMKQPRKGSDFGLFRPNHNVRFVN